MSGSTVRFRTTTRSEGDFAIDGDPDQLDRARRAVVDLPWVWLRQVHGSKVHVVEPGDEAAVRGCDGDALVTAHAGVALAVQSADCVPVVLTAPSGAFGVAHAGWRGLEAGILEATVAAVGELGPGQVHAHIGPCVGVECYEFGADDLARMVERFGPEVAGTTLDGRPALDTSAAARLALERVGARVSVGKVAGTLGDRSRCTACNEPSWYSYRARCDGARMATVAWRAR